MTAAKRCFGPRAAVRRSGAGSGWGRSRSEVLESRSLLTALIINDDNVAAFTKAGGRVEVTSANLAGKDSLVIEGISVTSTSGNGITIDLTGISLNSIAIESVIVNGYGAAASDTGIAITLTSVTSLHTLAIEDVQISNPSVAVNALGIGLNLRDTDIEALTIDDSQFPGVRITAAGLAGVVGSSSEIGQSLITKNTINAKSNIEGILTTVTAGTANNMRIEDNLSISSPNRDYVKFNASNVPVSGLSISGNAIGTTTQGAGLRFRAAGDTFLQPFTLQNNSTKNELLQTFTLDLTGIGQEFDINSTSGKPFTAIGTSGTVTGVQSSVVSADKKKLTVTFNDFNPGETLQFLIDIDLAGGIPAAIFGDDLIGADVTSTFLGNGNRTVSGQMIGDPAAITASEFAIGPGVSGNVNGINLLLSNAPLSNLNISDNEVTAASSHGLLIDADSRSNVEGVIRDNKFESSGKDGIRFDLQDSDFSGAVVGNSLSNNGGYGMSVLPRVLRSGLVTAAVDSTASAPIIITSVGHGLSTGDQIELHGMVNRPPRSSSPTKSHPGNGHWTITKIDNNRFSLNVSNGNRTDVTYDGGGAWYKTAKNGTTFSGLVRVDMQTPVPSGVITAATNAGPIVITSAGHGLITGQRVRISNVGGNTAANGVFQITQIDANRFSLNGTTGNGTYVETGNATWTLNAITGVANSAAGLVITSAGHGLVTGQNVRVTGVQGINAANGTFRVSILSANTFRLDGVTGTGTYTGGGHWVSVLDGVTNRPQIMSGNTITGNSLSGVYVDLLTGTMFQGDLTGNVVSQNGGIGVQVRSHSFGSGNGLPGYSIPGNNLQVPVSLPAPVDTSFSINIGSGAAKDGNTLHQNKGAGIAIEALDYGTGSFEIRNNVITATLDDNLASTVYRGEGVSVRLTRDLFSADSVALLTRSIIDGNTIGVDNLGNDGNGLLFTMTDQTRIQDLDLTNNTFLNNKLDGFHFERREDAFLSNVEIRKNRATNNGSDGISILATNTVKDALDFVIAENVIDANDAYGVRLEVSTDARLEIDFNQNSVTGNGDNPAGSGFHPRTDGTGNTGSAGGVGILAYQQAAIRLTGADNRVDGNIGDGFSVDAFNFFDSLKLDLNLSNSSFSQNTLTGFRSHGTSFGQWVWTQNTFSSNGEDGVRVVSIEDKADFFERRVGGQDISIKSLGSHFESNTLTGVRLGQGVSGVFGDGTDPNANYFDSNGQDGLKITQSGGAYLAARNSNVSGNGFTYEFRRHIGGNRNYFRNNGGDGVDIGHDAATETGNVEFGDETITDTHVSMNSAIITGNGGDGVEYLADSILRLAAVTGGGQENFNLLHNSSLNVSNSRISGNAKRGIDILNRVGEDSTISIINNQIFSNLGEAIYVVNTAAHQQKQSASSDPLEVYLEENPFHDDDSVRVYGGTKQREIKWEISPNIELRVQDNSIESNGSPTGTSTVPITASPTANDASGVPNVDWAPSTQQIAGTLGGLVIRVGAVDSAGRFTRSGIDSSVTLPANSPEIRYLDYTSNPNWELGLSGIDAEVFRNHFDGNVGADVYTDSFTSQVPAQTQMRFGDGADPFPFNWYDPAARQGYRDPLARLNMSFRENEGNSLDLLNGFAFLDNHEPDYKRRQVGKTPPGDFIGVGFFRNQQRTIGMFNDIGDNFTTERYYRGFFNDGNPPTFRGYYSYDGHGTSTFRVESDFDTNNFSQTSPSLGFSDFYDTMELNVTSPNVQWDTGTNQGGFEGNTPWSLRRGDIFNVKNNQAPITADSLEENDSFIGASDLGVLNASTTLNVNSRALNNALTLHTKRDRDYYSFVADRTMQVNITVSNTDAAGDDLVYMLYKIDESQGTEEQAVLRAANGDAQFVVVSSGATQVLTAGVEAGFRYALEVFSNEAENVVSRSTVLADPISNAGKLAKFKYGTVRSYTVGVTSGVAQGAVPGAFVAAVPNAAAAGSSVVTASGNVVALGSLPGAPVPTFVAVTPAPRTTAVPSVTLNFNEDVTGVDIADFGLTRNGVNVPLNAAAGVTVTRVNAMQYTITLGQVTGQSGNYSLSLTAAGSGIKDLSSNNLLLNATTAWTVANSVNVTADNPDTAPGDGTARDRNGNISLRAAVMESNATPGADFIQLGSAVYTLTAAGRAEDEALTGDLDVRGQLTISGVSARATIIDAADLDRVFQVFAGATLILENLTIRNGEEFDGAGIHNVGKVILRNVNVMSNEAFNQGGGIYNEGRLNTLNTSIYNNVAGSRGGGIANIGTGTNDNGISEFVNTTISTNSAVSRGGGIFNEEAAVSRMINVTVANNHAGAEGGGVASEPPAAGVTTSTNATFGNTVISNNTSDLTLNAFADLYGPFTSLGSNLVGVLDAAYGNPVDAGMQQTDQWGTTASPRSAGLNTIRNTGGNGTWYHPSVSNTGATVDRGNYTLYQQEFARQPLAGLATNAADRLVDQIGSPRQIEGSGDTNVTIDIGAVEFFRNVPVSLIIATPNPAGVGDTVRFDGSTSTHSNPSSFAIVSWEWDFNYVNNTFTVDATGGNVTTTFPTLGIKKVALRVTDNQVPAQTSIKVIDVTVAAPPSPTIVRPSATVTTDRTPLLRWEGGTGTFSLTLSRLNTNNTVQTPPVVSVGNLTASSYTPTTPLLPGRYRLIVNAANGSGTASSLPFDFEIRDLVLNAPAGQVFDQTPVFNWNTIVGTSRYELQVDRTTAPAAARVIYRASIAPPASGSSMTFTQTTTQLGEGGYRWWVRAFDVDGLPGQWSLAKSFEVVRPKITSLSYNVTPAPTYSFATLDTTPTFTWTLGTESNAVLNAARYELEVNQVGGASRVIYQPAIVGKTFTPTTALANGTYTVRVRAVAGDGEPGLWSDTVTFQMNYNLGPSLISPSGTLAARRPPFRWQAIDGAQSYELLVENTTTGTPVQVFRVAAVPHVAGAASISYQHPSLFFFSGNYRWQVRAKTATGVQTAWSTPNTFTINKPVITSPVNNSVVTTTSSPTFTWTGSSEFTRYEIQVEKVSTNQIVIQNTNITTTSYTNPLPLENGTFRVMVRGFDNAGNFSQFSDTSTFTLNVSTALVATSPRSTVESIRPTFTWSWIGTTPTNIVRYELIVKQMSAAGQPVVLQLSNLTGNSYTATTALVSGQSYRWWIRGITSAGTATAYSQPADFIVAGVTSDVAPMPDADDFTGLLPDLRMNASPLAAGASMAGQIDVATLTVHPAGVQIHVSEQERELLIDETVRQRSASSDSSADRVLDKTMTEFAMSGWDADSSSLDSLQLSVDTAEVVAVPSSEAVGNLVEPPSKETETTTDRAGFSGVVAGLMLSVFGRRRSSRDSRDE
ncbi:MAG: hypothetical protein ACK526_03110 [Planctomyces sp.]